MAAPSSNGGSQITSYQMQVRFSDKEDWKIVMGEEPGLNLQLIYTVPESDNLSPGAYV